MYHIRDMGLDAFASNKQVCIDFGIRMLHGAVTIDKFGYLVSDSKNVQQLKKLAIEHSNLMASALKKNTALCHRARRSDLGYKQFKVVQEFAGQPVNGI